MFSVDEASGEITTIGRLSAGEYNIRVNVHDAVWQLTVESTVNVVVKHITREAVLSSGSIRFTGNDFIGGFFLSHLQRGTKNERMDTVGRKSAAVFLPLNLTVNCD